LLSKVLSHYEFHGTSIRDFIDQLRQETGENIVIPVEAQDYVIPDLVLQNVTAEQALQAAFNSTGYDFRVVVISSGEPGEARIIRVVSSKMTVPKTENIVTRIYGLRGITGAGDTLPDLATNVEAASLKALGAYKKSLGLPASVESMPEFALHEPTKLLIVTGTEEDLAIVTQVITALGGTAGTSVAPPLQK
jgi:type II secretory pathway component GspD/PulD (secretin)